MGCGSSKSEAVQRRREADEYARRKKHGFKDPGLEKVRKQAVRKKKHLKHVEYDPTSPQHRQQKMNDINKSRQQQQKQQQQNQKKKGGGWGNKNKNKNKKNGEQQPLPPPPPMTPVAIVMTEGTIAAQRKKLKHVN